MNTSKVILIAIVASFITSVGTFAVLRALSTARDASSETVLVPGLIGLRPDQGRQLLSTLGLLLLIDGRREDPKVSEGLIVSQTPLEGSRMKNGAEVRVLLSSGMSAVELPRFDGLPLASVLETLNKLGLKVGQVNRQEDAHLARDQVIRSVPAAGEKVNEGAMIDLLVSNGEAKVKVPRVIGHGLSRARQSIEAAGLKVGRITYGSDEDRVEGIILRQNPVPDQMVLPQATVDLVVNES